MFHSGFRELTFTESHRVSHPGIRAAGFEPCDSVKALDFHLAAGIEPVCVSVEAPLDSLRGGGSQGHHVAIGLQQRDGCFDRYGVHCHNCHNFIGHLVSFTVQEIQSRRLHFGVLHLLRVCWTQQEQV